MDAISTKLIDALKERYPKKGDLANVLLDILPLGKEAIYRRLRGEIEFTLQESIVICRKLRISIDQIMGIKSEDSYTFHLMDIFSCSKMEAYGRMIKHVNMSMEYVISDPNSFSYQVHNSLPQDFAFKYETISKVFLYILCYQMFPHSSYRRYDSYTFSQGVLDEMSRSVDIVHEMNELLILDDNNSFRSFLDSIKYYRKLTILNDTVIDKMKGELLQLIDELEKCAATGLLPSGKNIEIYISHVPLDATYSYIQGNGFRASSMKLYGVDYLACDNDKVCDAHKSWIEACLRFSTLISTSCEQQRNEYFRRQRNLINAL